MRITTQNLERIKLCLDEQASNLLPILRWLVLDRDLSEALFDEVTREPTVDEVYALMQCVQANTPPLMAPLRTLIMGTEFRESTMAELQLDDLLVADGWNHPARVLGRSRVSLDALLIACRRRLGRAEDDAWQSLKVVEGRLKRSLQIEQAAQKRRRDARWNSRGGQHPRVMVERQGAVPSGQRAP